MLRLSDSCPVVKTYLTLFMYVSCSTKYNKFSYSDSDFDFSACSTDCVGTIHASKNRYLWIDLSGDGVMPGGEFHSLAAFHGPLKSQKSLPADLSSLVWSAYQVLLVSSLRIPVPFENSLLVQFIHVRSGSVTDLNSEWLDWKKAERTLSEDGGLLLRD